MRKKNKSFEGLAGFCLIFGLALSLLYVNVCAWASGQKDATATGAAVSQETPSDSVKPAGSEDHVDIRDANTLADRQERLSYALGMVVGKQFRTRSVEVNPDLYAQGLKDALAGGGTLLTETEARVAVNELQSELKSKRPAPTPPDALNEIKVSFKLDPRLTRSMYMGDRWVSPPTFTSTRQEGTELAVEARAMGFDINGRPISISPEWKPADSDMVKVTHGKGGTVRITVKRAGQSDLKVVAAGVTKKLFIKAFSRDNAMQVEITQ